MNNSLPRLIDGMIESLRREVIPHVAGEFPRGQVFGVIYMLESIKRRASWSNAFLGEQLAALAELSHALAPLALPGAPVLAVAEAPALPSDAELIAARDAGDEAVGCLIDWLAAHRDALAPEAAEKAETAIDAYLRRQLRFEIATAARPMFAEISSGQEAADKPRS